MFISNRDKAATDNRSMFNTTVSKMTGASERSKGQVKGQKVKGLSTYMEFCETTG